MHQRHGVRLCLVCEWQAYTILLAIEHEKKDSKVEGCCPYCQRIALTGWGALRGVAHWFQQECILQVDQTKSSLQPPRYHPCTDCTLPCIHLQQLHSATLPNTMCCHSNFSCFRFSWSVSLVVCQPATNPATLITAELITAAVHTFQLR